MKCVRMLPLSVSVLLVSLGFCLARIACPETAGAQELTVADVFSEPIIEGVRPSDAVLSADEKWVAYTWNAMGYRNRRDLYVVETSGGDPRPLTAFHATLPADTLTGTWEELRGKYGRQGQGPAGGPEDLEKLPVYFDDPTAGTVGEIVWSPDSKRLAFTDRGDVFVVDVANGRLQRLTRSPAAESQPQWSPDGTWLSYLRGNSVWMTGLKDPQQIEVQDLASGEQALLGHKWSPNGQWIAFLLQDDSGRGSLVVPHYLPDQVTNEPVRQGYPDMRVGVVDLRPWLQADAAAQMHDHDALPVKKLELGPGKHPDINVYDWSPDGQWLLCNEILPDMQTRKIHVADPASGDVHLVFSEIDTLWKEEYDWGQTDAANVFWSEDAGSIYTLAEHSGFQHLVRITLAAALASDGGWKQEDLLPLTAGDWTVDWARRIAGQPKQLLLLTSRRTTTQRHLELLSVDTGALTTLRTTEGSNSFPQVGKRGKWALYQHSRFNVPYDLWSIELRADRDPRQLTQTVAESFLRVDWNVPEIVSFASGDGTPLKGLLYRPENFDPQKKYPVVVFVHGAGIMQNVLDGWTVYSPNYKFHTVLTQRGFVVFEVDYRGSLGYGREFRAGTRMYVGGKDLEDELAGVEYLKTLGFIDEEHIGIYGGSYGGFMTLMALFHAPETYAAGAALRFVTDWQNYYTGNPWYCIKRLGTPEENPAAYYRSSPLHFAENLQDPLLLLHGVRDNNVHFQDAAQLIERLIRLGKDFDLMVYPVERHGFERPSSWIDEYQRIEDFFEKHLQGRD